MLFFSTISDIFSKWICICSCTTPKNQYDIFKYQWLYGVSWPSSHVRAQFVTKRRVYLFNTFYSLGFNEVRRKEKQACEGVYSRAGGSVRPRVKLNANMLTGNTLMCIRYNFSLVYRVNVIKSCQLALNTDYSRGSWECQECCKYLIITQSIGLINWLIENVLQLFIYFMHAALGSVGPPSMRQ